MHIFFDPNIQETLQPQYLNNEEAHHATKVLRIKKNDKILIVNGKGCTHQCLVNTIGKKNCEVSVIKTTNSQRINGEQFLHLAIAPTKNKERLEWLFEKCTEIGIREITPLLCERSERKSINMDRLSKILIAAMKQSKRSFLPKLNPLTKFREFLNMEIDGDKFIAHCEDTPKKPIKEQLKKDQPTFFLIGPEGDFSPYEIQLAKEKNFVPSDLGTYRLRTETAGLVISSIFNNI